MLVFLPHPSFLLTLFYSSSFNVHLTNICWTPIPCQALFSVLGPCPSTALFSDKALLSCSLHSSEGRYLSLYRLYIYLFNCFCGISTWMYNRPFKLNMFQTGTLPPQSLCICCSLCMEWSTRCPHGSHFLLPSNICPKVNFSVRLSWLFAVKWIQPMPSICTTHPLTLLYFSPWNLSPCKYYRSNFSTVDVSLPSVDKANLLSNVDKTIPINCAWVVFFHSKFKIFSHLISFCWYISDYS